MWGLNHLHLLLEHRVVRGKRAGRDLQRFVALADSNADANTDANTDSNADSDANTDADSNTDSNTDSDANTDSNADTNANADTNTDADSDTNTMHAKRSPSPDRGAVSLLQRIRGERNLQRLRVLWERCKYARLML